MPGVLIVDDAAFMRMSLKTILERNGIRVTGEAENGFVAVKKCRELMPDIITMDITMPEMDGIEALKEIRKFNSDVKVIMVSAMGQETYVREAILSGAREFILKPFKEESIVNVLSKLSK